MKLFVQEYLLTHSLDDLELNHGVKARFNSKQNKFSLNYDQFKVKDGDPIAEQCRGLILRENSLTISSDKSHLPVGETTILAWPLNRFYNFGQHAAAELDWNDSSLTVFEKLDGTMCILYWDNLDETWHIATRSVPEADLPLSGDSLIHAQDLTFAKLFWQAFFLTVNSNLSLQNTEAYFQKSDYALDEFNKNITYIFELTTPLNRIRIKYDDFRVTLLAARETQTGIELPIQDLRLSNIPLVKSWSPWSKCSITGQLKYDVNELVIHVNEADPSMHEGCVVVDSQWQRIKIKNKAWVLSSRAKDMISTSRRKGLECIIDGSIDDIIPIIDKDIASALLSMQEKLKNYVSSVDERFRDFNEQCCDDRKSFARLVMGSGDWTTPYFCLFNKNYEDTFSWLKEQSMASKLTPTILDTLLKMIDMESIELR